MTAKKILNIETLQSWQVVDPDNWQILVQDLIQLFSTVGKVQHSELQSMWKAGDRIGLSKVAHSLKSSCGNIGAELAHEKLDQIEKTAAELSEEQLHEQIMFFLEATCLTRYGGWVVRSVTG